MEEAIANLRNFMNTDDTEAIKEATEKLSEAFYPIAQKMYAQTNQGAGAGAGGYDPNGAAGAGYDAGPQQGAGGNNDDNVVDADFTVED